jgi:threonine aldolase
MHQAKHSSTDTAAEATAVLESHADRRDSRHRNALERRLQSEFQEIPGLCLAPIEASRLFGIALDVCERVLSALAQDNVLTVRPDGRFVHRSSA